MKEKIKSAASLFLFFVRIGCFTFGGGWSILAQMDQEFVQKEKIITKEELMDITSVGRSLPGIMITNISVLFGYHVAGVLGAIATTIGIAFPSVVILTVITFLYTSFKENMIVLYILQGIRSAVVPIILTSVISLWKAALPDKICILFLLGAFLCSLFSPLGNIQIVLIGILIGFIIFLSKSKKGVYVK